MSNMSQQFTLFPSLPAELRREIWLHALSAPWSITSFRRAGRSIKCVGHVHIAVSQTCREARAAVQASHRLVSATWSTRYRSGDMFHGWVNFSRHLFIVRDLDFDLGLLKEILAAGILAHVQHLVVNATDYWQQYETVLAVRKHCPALRNIVVVCPWLDRTLVDVDDDIAPYEDWASLFRKTPREVDWAPLLQAIERQEPENVYKEAMDQAKIQKILDGFPNGAPSFFMRSRNQIRHPERPLDYWLRVPYGGSLDSQ